MLIRVLILCSLLSAGSVFAQTKKAPPKTTGPVPTGPTAIIDSTAGKLTCKLFDKQAPEGVANFIGLAEGTKDWTNPTTHKVMHGVPLYNGTVFHRVIPQFMIQGGDPQ